MRPSFFAILLVAAALVPAEAQVRDGQVGDVPARSVPIRELTGAELIGSFRELREQTVKVTDCVIAGVTQMFIRCETPTSEGRSYVIEAASMPQSDFRWALAVCPTGAWKNEVCRGIAVIGEIANRKSPQLLRARFDPPRTPQPQ